MDSQTISNAHREKAPLKISWRNFEGTEGLISGIEAELDGLESHSAISRCQVTVEAIFKGSYQATVLLELAGIWRLSRARISDPMAAVREAFASARAHLVRGGMRRSIDVWGMFGPPSANGRSGANS